MEKLGGDTEVVNPGLNKTALVLGMSSCLGMCIVATFQVRRSRTRCSTFPPKTF